MLAPFISFCHLRNWRDRISSLPLSASDRESKRVGERMNMLKSYFPIYQVAVDIGKLSNTAGFMGHGAYSAKDEFQGLVERVRQVCLDHGLIQTSDFANRVLRRPLPATYSEALAELNHLNDALSYELEKEAVFRVTSDKVPYFEQRKLFGPEVSIAFPSCARDIQKAGECYALKQEDACVHHLMMVLERGLGALAARLSIAYERTNWQQVITAVAVKLKAEPRGPARDYLLEVNAQFGFLKDAYRNHSEHARDDPYDIEKALSILNHVRDFMHGLARGGLTDGTIAP